MIVLPWPGESACAAPQKSAAASEARITSRLRCERPTSEAKPASAIRSGAWSILPLRERGRDVRPAAGRDLGRGGRHVERAREQVLRVGAELVAAARRARRRPRSPSSRSGRRSWRRGRRFAPGRRARAGEDDLEPRRVQAARARRVRERLAERDEPRRPAVDGEVRVRGDAPRVGAGVDVAGLEGRDLGQVEHVEHVEAVARDLDAAEAVDREVAERVRGGGRRARAAPPRPRAGGRAASSQLPPRRRGPEHREARVQRQRAAEPASRRGPVAEAALDRAAVEELERVARARAAGRCCE